MNSTMKAAVVREFGKPLVIEEVSVPRPGAGEVLVRIEACGVCHTDLHAAEGDWPVKPNPPFIPGHEGVGHVVAVGGGVGHVKEGDRVGIPWLYSACGHCEHCLGGWETLCETQRNTGYSVNGGFAEYALADANYVGLLPKEVGFVEIAPVLCAGVTVYKGLKVTDTKPGDWVAVSGIGGLGHMAVQYARAMGLNVAAVDVDDNKLALARQLGAQITVNARTTDPAAFLKKEIGGAHGALVTAVSPKAFEQALGMVRRGGTVSLNGLPPGNFPLDIFGMVLNGITVRGSIVGTRLDLQESLQFAAEGKVAATVSTDRLENINDVFARMHAGTIEGRVGPAPVIRLGPQRRHDLRAGALRQSSDQGPMQPHRTLFGLRLVVTVGLPRKEISDAHPPHRAPDGDGAGGGRGRLHGVAGLAGPEGSRTCRGERRRAADRPRRRRRRRP